MKTQLWENLLMAALGEVASTREKMDDLFVRHTYLTAVIGMVVVSVVFFLLTVRRLRKMDVV